MQEPKRYLGLELAGAKNQKTAVASIQFFPKERKVFLLDIYDKIAAHEHQTGDEALLELLGELAPGVARMGVNVPLEFPPCVHCTRKVCPLPSKCTVPAVKWMRDATRKASRQSQAHARIKEFTPYTQRPIELWIRYQVLPKLPEGTHFDIDEALGGNKAPLTSRMAFLKRQFPDVPLLEAWPKLTVSILAAEMGLPKKVIAAYRRLEEGADARARILEALSASHGIFIYDRDLRKLSQSLAAFDAFVCAYTALLSDLGRCAKAPQAFPSATGWLAYPQPEA